MNEQVIIVGGGVIGVACAYFLSRRNVPVQILEHRHLGSGCTGATAAMINTSSTNPIPEPLRPFTIESHRLIRELEPDFEKAIEISHGGSLIIATNEQEAQTLKAVFEEIRQRGGNCSLLDGSEVRRLEPLLVSSVTGAIHNPDNYQVNPFRLCEGFLSAALRRRSMISYGIKVREVKVYNGRIDRVVTDKGDYHADYVVIAAGVYTPQILANSGIEIPIIPARGQVIITEAYPPMIHHPLAFLTHLYIKQVVNGNFYIGSHTEFAGFNSDITLDKITTFARVITRAMPILARVRALRFFAGLRPMTPDRLPIIGPVPDCRRLILAAGHCSTGIRYCASTGKAVSELILNGKTEIPIEAFGLDRFV